MTNQVIEEIPFIEGIKKTKREHPGYTQYQKVKNLYNPNIPCLFGQWQYLYENEKGGIVIDAILLPNYFRDGQDFWEIWSEGKLFSDIERFYTLEEAEERIKEIFNK
ncbi:MAG TPA: hypothetical protein VF220_01530 [Nitrososphaeraceae archaeon]